MQFIAIILLGVLAAVFYGIVHDQVTARICVEYFTIGHPPVFVTENSTLLALGWGVLATWWAGLLLGVLLALAARLGTRPKLRAGDLLKPIGVLLFVMAVCAVIAGGIGGIIASAGWITLVEPLASQIPREKHTAFLIDGWAHSASYLIGFIGAIVLVVRTIRKRGRLASGNV